MANIPLAEVPNAPQLAGPVLTEYPQARLDLRQAAAEAQQTGIAPGAFDGPAEALQSLGAATAQMGGVFGQLSERMLDSANAADVARAEGLMDGAKAKFLAERGQRPEKEWPGLWETKYRPQLDKELDGLKLSAWSWDRVKPEVARFSERMKAEAKHDGHDAQIARDRTDLLKGVERDVTAGNYERAFGRIETMVQLGHLTAEEGTKQTRQIVESQTQKNWTRLVEDDPWMAVEVAQEGAKNGRVEGLSVWDGDKKRFGRMAAEAERQAVQREADTQAMIHAGILHGEIKTAAQVREAAGPTLREPKIQRLAELAESEPLYHASSATRLRTEVRGFQPQGDADYGRYEFLMEKVMTELPKEMQSQYAEELHSTWQRRGKWTAQDMTRDRQARVFERIDAYARVGMLGQTDTDIETIAKRAEVLKFTLDDYVTKNPQAAPDAVSQHLSETLKQMGYLKHGGMIFQQRLMPSFSR